jgi:hypothetical protein
MLSLVHHQINRRGFFNSCTKTSVVGFIEKYASSNGDAIFNVGSSNALLLLFYEPSDHPVVHVDLCHTLKFLNFRCE